MGGFPMDLSSQGRVSAEEMLENCLPLAFRLILCPVSLPFCFRFLRKSMFSVLAPCVMRALHLCARLVSLGVTHCMGPCLVLLLPPFHPSTWSECKAGSRGLALTC